VSLANGPTLRATDNLNYQANSTLPRVLRHGQFRSHWRVRGYVHGSRRRRRQLLTRTPAQTGEAEGWSTSASLLHSNYFWVRPSFADTLGSPSSANPRRRTWTIPPARFASRRVCRWHDVDQVTLLCGGGPASDAAIRPLRLPTSSRVQRQKKTTRHTIKITSKPLARAQHTSDVNASLGSVLLSIRSLTSRPGCRRPTRARCRRFTCRAISSRRGVSVGDACADEHGAGAVRRPGRREPFSLSTLSSTPRCAKTSHP